MSELPEHQIFHILRNGEEEPIGPYSQDELVELLNTEQIRASDYVYYPELTGWKPLSQVFDFHQQISNFNDEGQDPQIVAETFSFIEKRSEPNEEVYYIAVQQMPALSTLTAAVKLSAPKSIILSNWRFCILSQKLMGSVDFQEYPIEQIEGSIKKIKAGANLGTFNIVLKSGDWVGIDRIPVAQLERLEHLSYTILEDYKNNLL